MLNKLQQPQIWNKMKLAPSLLQNSRFGVKLKWAWVAKPIYFLTAAVLFSESMYC